MKISIFGLGYVGCVSLGCLAELGHDVIGIDIASVKVSLINQGKSTIVEEGIADIIAKQRRKGKISATTDYMQAVTESDFSFLCVGIPSSKTGRLEMRNLFHAVKQIGKTLAAKNSFHVVVIRSTVEPGTNEAVSSLLESQSGKQANRDFAVVSNPEFLREGTAVYDFFNPPFTVIASASEQALSLMTRLYAFTKTPIIKTEVQVAEIIKFINNSFHALKVSFANEIGTICKQLNIDSHQVMDLFVKDDKLNLSAYYLKPGFAYGGSCLPKDLTALKTFAGDLDLDVPVLEAVGDSNQRHIQRALDMILNKNTHKIGILGLSFKAGTDDLRNSPMVTIVERLIAAGREIRIYDDKVILSNFVGENKKYVDQHIPNLRKMISQSLEAVIEGSELVIVSQNNPEFRGIVEKYPDKLFIDFARIIPQSSHDHYEGICW